MLDLLTRTLTTESPPAGDSASTADSRAPSISSDGRFLVFDWLGASFGPAGPEPAQVMLRDRELGTTRMLSVTGSGAPADGPSSNAAISGDGRVVAFESAATNLVAGIDVNGRARDVYVVVPASGAMSRASVDGEGRQREGPSFSPAMSADGRYVVFTSDARLDDAPVSGHMRTSGPYTRSRHVFVRDLMRGSTRRVSRRPDGREPNAASFLPSISGDGRWVAFVSNATDLDGRVIRDVSNVYLHDLETSTTTLVSRGADGAASDGTSSRPVLSRNGRFVAFESTASNLVCRRRCGPGDRDINLVMDVFVFDRDQRSIVRVSSDPDSGWMEPSASAALDAHGRLVVFSSRHPIADDDGGNDFDLFVATRCGDGETMRP